MRFHDFTGLGRTIDPRYRTNLAMMVLFSAAALMVGIHDASPWSGFRAGCAVFLAWALSRELDPDREMSAFLSVALILPALGQAELITSGPLFWLLLVMRLCNGTSGVRATLVDCLLVGWLAYGSGSWPLWAWTAVAFGIDAALNPSNRRSAAFAVAALGFGMRELWMRPLPYGALEWRPALWTLALAVVFFLAVQLKERLHSHTDVGELPMSAARVTSGRVLAIAATFHLVLWTGSQGAVSLLPFFAALLGTALYSGLARSLAESPRREPLPTREA